MCLIIIESPVCTAITIFLYMCMRVTKFSTILNTSSIVFSRFVFSHLMWYDSFVRRNIAIALRSMFKAQICCIASRSPSILRIHQATRFLFSISSSFIISATSPTKPFSFCFVCPMQLLFSNSSKLFIHAIVVRPSPTNIIVLSSQPSVSSRLFKFPSVPWSPVNFRIPNITNCKMSTKPAPLLVVLSILLSGNARINAFSVLPLQPTVVARCGNSLINL